MQAEEEDCCDNIIITSTPPPLTTTPGVFPSTQSTSPVTPTTKPAREDCPCPKYDPLRWNIVDQFFPRLSPLYLNNCYNYAINRQTNNYLQPGGRRHWFLNPPPNALTGAIKDGLVDLGNPGPGIFPETKDCLVALVHYLLKISELVTRKVIILEEWFHFYRRDSDGLWSHKPGQTQATNRDASGRLIFDPRTADLRMCPKCVLRYTFVTFLSYCPEDITIK